MPERNLKPSSTAFGSVPPAGLLGPALAGQTWQVHVGGVDVRVGVADGPAVGVLVAVGDEVGVAVGGRTVLNRFIHDVHADPDERGRRRAQGYGYTSATPETPFPLLVADLL